MRLCGAFLVLHVNVLHKTDSFCEYRLSVDMIGRFLILFSCRFSLKERKKEMDFHTLAGSELTVVGRLCSARQLHDASLLAGATARQFLGPVRATSAFLYKCLFMPAPFFQLSRKSSAPLTGGLVLACHAGSLPVQEA